MQTVYIRNEQKRDYTVVSNSIITDKRLSAEARATHIYLLSRPPKWKAWNKDIQTVMGFGRRVYLRVMQELRDAGYQSLEKGGEGGGNVLTIYEVSGSHDMRLPQNATIAKRDHIVSTDKSNNTDKRKSISVNDFARWYSHYPLKKGKKPAYEAWKKAKGMPDVDTMISTIQLQIENDRQYGGETKFIPYPATYLNQERWNDELEHGRKQETVSDEYAARVAREDAILSKLHGGAVVNNGQVVPSSMDEAERRIGFTPVPGLDG